jgi:hypothetical protein
MPKALRILWSGLVNAYDAAFAIILSNIYFVVITFAIFILSESILNLVYLILVLPLTITGLFYTNFQIAASESVDWKTFFVGIKRYWWAGFRWTIINFIVIFSTVWYFYVFVSREELWSSALLGLDLGVMAFWILMQFMTFPMMLIQEKPAFLLSLRNTMIFLVRWPGFSFTFLVPMLILVIASFFFPPLAIFFSIGLVAYLGSYAVFYRIDSEKHPELYKDPKQTR